MAFDPKPSTWLPSWSEDATNISVPIASFPELTAAEADGTTGDIRKVVFAVLAKLYAVWAATDAANRPTKMLLYKSATQDVDTGKLTTVFTAQFETDITAQEVADEPA
jgi:hypothetical protein